MGSFENIKANLQKRKEEKELSKNPSTIEEDCFEMYFNVYSKVRSHNFGYSKLTEDEKQYVADLASLYYTSALFEKVSLIISKDSKKLSALAGVLVCGIGFVVAGVITGEQLLRNISVATNFSVAAYCIALNVKNAKQRKNGTSYIDKVFDVDFDEFKERAESRFDKITDKKLEQNQKIM